MFAIAVSAFASSMIAAVVIVMMVRTFAEHGESARRALTGEQPPARPYPVPVREWRPRPARTMRQQQRLLRAAA